MSRGAVVVKQKRSVGPVTLAAAFGGAGVGGAVARILVHVFPELAPVEDALEILISAAFGVLGGYLVPPKDEPGKHAAISDDDADVGGSDGPHLHVEAESRG